MFRRLIIVSVFVVSVANAGGGVYEINAACSTIGCFDGDLPGTATIEISNVVGGGTFRLSSDIQVSGATLSAIAVTSTASVTIDLNGYQVICEDPLDSCGSNFSAKGISIAPASDVTIINGSIKGFRDNIGYTVSAHTGRLTVDGVLLADATDDAVSANYGMIKNSVFRNNRFGINMPGTGPSGMVIENNLFYDTRSSAIQEVLFSDTRSESCSGNVINYGGTISNLFCTQLQPNQCGFQLCTEFERAAQSAQTKPE